jgi:lambda family phage portal protein
MGMYDLVTGAVSGVLGVFNPKAAAKYRMGREALKQVSGLTRSLQAGRLTGPNQLWNPTATTADQELKNLSTVRARCRNLVQSDPWAAGAYQAIPNSVVGLGRDPQPMVQREDGTPWVEANQALLDLWWSWVAYADLAGGTVYDLQTQSIKSQITDGGLIIREYVDPTPAGIPLRFEAIEVDQLDTTVDWAPWHLGVKLDKGRKPVAYAITTEHPGDMMGSGDVIQVGADQIFHTYRKDRPSQTIGMPWLAPIVWRLFDLADYLDYEQIGAKLAAAFGVFITTDFTGNIFGAAGGDNADDVPQDYIEPGRIQRLKPGEKIEIASHNRPNSGMEAFIRTVLRSGAAGLNMSYATFANDHSKANYSNMRSSKLEERANYRAIHARQDNQLYTPMWRKFVRWAIWSGRLEIDGHKVTPAHLKADPHNWTAVLFPPPVFPWVDPKKDVEAEILKIENHLGTATDFLRGQGKDIHDVYQTLAEEKKLRKKLGLKAEPVQAPAPAANDDQADVDPDQPGEIDQEGETDDKETE